MFDRRLITHFNWPLLGVALALATAGLFNLNSATSSFDTQSQTSLVHAQLVWNGIGLAVLVIVVSLHYRHLQSLSYFFYFASLLFLLLVLWIGKVVAGHQSWITLGPLTIQPTEFAKLGLIFVLSKYFVNRYGSVERSLTQMIPPLLLMALPTSLVILQGDLGSSLFFGLLYGTFVLVRGLAGRLVVLLSGVLVVVAVVVTLFFLSPYQKARLSTFLHPESDPKGAGYHVLQSKIAVGSGEILGKGYLKGQTHKLKFVPERHTDFVFPVLAEEWGFVGASSALIGYFVLLILGLNIAWRAPDRFSFYLCSGVCALFFWHLVVNVGGVLGLLPMTGVPLPFFSYGGSSLLVSWIGVAILLNVSMRRFIFSATLGRSVSID